MNIDNSLKALGIANPSGTGWLAVVFTFILAWLITWGSIPTVRQFALRVGWADQPNARRLNREPLPNAGGLAIYAGVIAAVVFASLFRPIELQGVLAQVLTILLGGSILVLVGFIDDQFGLPPFIRLWTQIITALLLVANGMSIKVMFGTPIDSFLSTALTVLWIVGITNAVNLMDGMDGLAGGISFITAMSLLGVSAQFDNRAAATLVLAALSGAALGFLRHNFYPSRIIMGDAGAYFLGYVLAATSILGKLQESTIYSLIPTVLFLMLPVLDTTQVFIKRLLAGKNPLSTPGKDHLHHRLLAWGFSQRRASLILWSLTLFFNILAMSIQAMTLPVIFASASAIVLFMSSTLIPRVHSNS
ncbi:undecaprenyl/decaprenyl-phosphate alpha-N-acetylglucosaminyl 1-phosphate transferase [Cylindrospermopsis raciborskii S07]|jgi:UDP-GlcNAc:undecaprenyl-phosphate GlcNAc-1-phosphate transferase|uniref:Undecaprenyl-phosphate alpha-N-acetylglucosaminyl 1-phosphate transferase n=3 Tax=Cylindrospermopsis raciborskii TaxID=77022 RepID=A0A853MJM1_9CYAN|nr:MraY family glycosyltransferase [Cylindrospermopsis raciborskii]MBU6345141.1 undecaprenyl/decaprenyl-phosphate alpha-N-acetylglucosaminyl 1-phosphate transferase [Cyanobacteria bacterium REEB494]EFA68658.1 Glycosyl transferase, family 4 [Cylindrospermopsis raciborskii CS-505]MBA4445698.1 undecaprenyl/decaprenyl-phosphate alpha-N-acetylglucosaminyl 1-phosphate transferase [Cylindrospermopsis raciborskii CS-506_C]MBA4449934.1 undecaprenyl/decaprenyl-phosphate alpha-N-acetylglucosaminyl 1-phosp